ncbi:TonB-dependent receptor [Flammeovirga yaeyamensis]|uniref:TonB-dependent receptor n=2 Tax=Flammeovirga yaeyamensis TaxID=367791 RepID=A0AAX1NF40_9BACT|nr:TonB-dependent receptor [Flammeovirga yaeyamensis]MBB3699975.1 iron complex outermembrane receptor protein [Flammeovirga yaeyamensis]NMF37586.1 TonB-dependent receptor [Flammeovirga yaeyamensis]QWG04643.1 TonB-dependent receptor [Flammeovirga yaeyamensis]
MQNVFIIMVLLILSSAISTFSQDKDSLKTVYLGEVLIQSDTITNNDYQLTIDQLMNQQTDLNVVKRGGFAWEPIIDGFSDGQITVSVDGMRVFYACTDKMDPATSYLEPINLSTFRVAKAGDAQRFGTSLGGTLQAEMKYPELNQGTHAGIQSFYSSNTNGYDGNLFVEQSSEKFGFRYSGALRKHGIYRDGHGQEVPYTQFQKQNHTLTTVFKPNHQHEFKGLFMFDEGRDIGYPALPMDVSSATAYMGNIGYKNHVSDRTFELLQAKVYVNSVEHIMDDTKRENVAMHMDMPGRSTTFGAWFQADRNTELHHQEIRVEGFSNHLFADMRMYSPIGGPDMYLMTWGDIQRNNASLFLLDEWELDPRLTWTNNLRAEYNYTELTNDFARKQFETLNTYIEDGKHHITGNFSSSFLYQLNDAWSSNFGIAFTHRAPTASEMYGYYLFNARDRFDYVGNPDIETEKAFEFNFNIGYEKNGWKFAFNARKVFLDDYIVGVIQEDLNASTPGALGVKKYENVGKANTSHLSMLMGKEISNWLYYQINFRMDNGFIDALHTPTPYMSPLMVDQRVAINIKKLQVGLNYTYCDGMSTPADVLGEQKTSAYHLFDLSLDYGISLRKGTLNLSAKAENIFDAYYIDPFAWNNIPNMGRNLKFGVGYTF